MKSNIKKEIIAEAEAGKDVVLIDGITLKVINKHDSIILHDFPKWKDTERIAEVLQLDTIDRQPVIIRQRAGFAAWKCEIVGSTDEGISYNDNINPVSYTHLEVYKRQTSNSSWKHILP